MDNFLKKIKHILPIFLVPLLFHRCIKEAPLNPEADIEAFEVDKNQLTGNVFINQINRTITLNLTKEAYNTGIKPTLKLSTGATVVPASGTPISFGNAAVVYEVTSASGQNKKQYTVKVINVGKWDFSFEKWAQNQTDGYEYPLEDDDIQLWSSGNPGVALSGVAHRPDAFPTRSTTDHQDGSKAAELVTLKGTALSELIGVRLFAGSLFLGNFNSIQAMLNPLAATEFGQPYVGLPERFVGYYKYQSGPEFIDKEGKVIAGRKDQCAIYAVLFNGPDRLDATNIKTSAKVIATAELPDGSDRAAFTKFDIPFVFKEGVTIGSNLMMAIVVSSSAEGDQYRGAIGSRLIVDGLSIVPKS
jgi:hypothetical protein